MKRKISTLFSKKTGRGRDLGQCVAAAVVALTLTATGAAGYAASLFETPALLVEPDVTYIDYDYDGGDKKEEEEILPTAEGQEALPEVEAAETTEAAGTAETAPEMAAPKMQEAAPASETVQPEAPAAEAPETAGPAAEAQPDAIPDLTDGSLEEENAVTAVWQEMTNELAAEDPLAARYEAVTPTPDASGKITLTPDEFNALLENQQIDWDEENCLSWFFNWLYSLFFPNRGSSSTPTQSYSGWRTKNGRTYYYDPSTHERLTGLQTIDDKIYYFDANGVMQENVTFGIDVSRYQQNVDWNKVKAAGASFAIIRIGYRGYETGALVLDSMFENHLAGAKAAGLKVGVYIFSQAINEEEAREEAFACAYVLNGRSLDYPVYFDSEYSTSSHTGRADNLTKAQRTACAVAFCEELKNYGYEPGVYASTSWFQNHLDLSALSGYRIWNAHYGVSAPSIDCDMWQGSCTGQLSGVSSSGVDLNISYMG